MASTTLWRRIVKNNAADPRVVGDVELLAAAYGTSATEPDEPPVADPSASDVELLASAYGTTEITSSQRPEPGVVAAAVGAHVRRNHTVYGVAAALLAVLVLVEPVQTVTEPPPPEFAASSGPSGAAAPAAPIAAAPLPGPVSALEQPAFDALFPTDAATFAPSPPSESFAPVIPPALADLLEPLRIVESGYASATGGTPLEQEPPGEGLPVTAVGPQATRYSYVRLAGTAPVLSLRLVDEQGANVNVDSAAVSMCRITDPGWKPQRGVPMDQAPAYDGAECVKGAAAEGGVWTFDLSTRSDRVDAAGFALVPSADASAPFQVVFSPAAS